MTIARTSLQHELERWERNLLRLADEDALVDQGSGQLMATIQATLTAYRSHILPALEAGQEDTILALAPYDAVIADEVAGTIDRLEDLRRELVAGGSIAALRLQVLEALAGLRALTRVAVRLGNA